MHFSGPGKRIWEHAVSGDFHQLCPRSLASWSNRIGRIASALVESKNRIEPNRIGHPCLRWECMSPTISYECPPITRASHAKACHCPSFNGSQLRLQGNSSLWTPSDITSPLSLSPLGKNIFQVLIGFPSKPARQIHILLKAMEVDCLQQRFEGSNSAGLGTRFGCLLQTYDIHLIFCFRNLPERGSNQNNKTAPLSKRPSILTASRMQWRSQKVRAKPCWMELPRPSRRREAGRTRGGPS